MGRWLTLGGCRNVVALLVIVAAGVSVPTTVIAGGGQSADLAITKTDGVTTAIAGGSVTYTITASNAGPEQRRRCDRRRHLPGGADGDVDVRRRRRRHVHRRRVGQYQRHRQPARRRIGHLHGDQPRSARRRRAPWSTPPPSPLRAVSATRTRQTTRRPTPTRSSRKPIWRSAKTDGVTTATAGGSVTYTITASNAGPSNAPGATVADTFPAALTATWTCVGAGGGTCTAAGSGNIDDTVNLPAGGSVTYTASASLAASATGTLVNTATVTAPAVSATRTRQTTRRPTPTRSSRKPIWRSPRPTASPRRRPVDR